MKSFDVRVVIPTRRFAVLLQAESASKALSKALELLSLDSPAQDITVSVKPIQEEKP